MRTWLSAVALLQAISSAAPISTSFQPTDDDAGTGADAGDLDELATPIAPGSYHGRLSGGIDPNDYYSFQASVGDFIHVRLSSDQRTFIFFLEPETADPPWGEAYEEAGNEAVAFGLNSGAEHTFALYRSGLWKIRVGLSSSAAVESVSYSFDVLPDRLAYVSVFESRAEHVTVEARWDGAMTGGLLTAWPIHYWYDRPHMWLEYDDHFLNGERSRSAWHGVPTGSPGQAIATTPTIAPGQTLPISFQSSGQYAWAERALSEDSGSVHRTLYRLGSNDPIVVIVYGDRPFEVAFDERDDGVSWGDADAATTYQLRAPGASVTGPRDFELPLESDFVGLFDPQGFEHEVVDPDGGRWHSEDGWPLWLIDAARGKWSFHMDTTYGASWGGGIFGADKLYFDGVPLIHLGLNGPPAP